MRVDVTIPFDLDEVKRHVERTGMDYGTYSGHTRLMEPFNTEPHDCPLVCVDCERYRGIALALKFTPRMIRAQPFALPSGMIRIGEIKFGNMALWADEKPNGWSIDADDVRHDLVLPATLRTTIEDFAAMPTLTYGSRITVQLRVKDEPTMKVRKHSFTLSFFSQESVRDLKPFRGGSLDRQLAQKVFHETQSGLNE